VWEIINTTPFAAERAWVRDKNGAEVWIVAVKGTFLISQDGVAQLADKQMEVCLAPKFRGEPNKSSLLYESDLVHTKLRTDVLLHGHAYAPKGQPTTEMRVRLKVADIDKELHVVGNRFYQHSLLGLRLSRPQPFTKMPLTYERAYGGTDFTSEDPKKHTGEVGNPVGRGFANRSAHLDGKPVPNIMIPKARFRKDSTAGFGPIAGHWAPRNKYAGTYDKNWEENRLPLLPEDFDERFYQSAPEDQQTSFLTGGELVELYNLTPEGFLRFYLPRIILGFTTSFGGKDLQQHRGVLHSIILEPDFPRVIMVWHTHLPCHHKVYKLLSTTVIQKRRIRSFKRNLSDEMPVGITRRI
jgi:hypothetical protein